MENYIIKEFDDFELKFKKDYEDVLDFNRIAIVKGEYGYYAGVNNLILLQTTTIFNYRGVYIIYNVAQLKIEQLFFEGKFSDNFFVNMKNRSKMSNVIKYSLFGIINDYNRNYNEFLDNLSENFKISYENYLKRSLGLSEVCKHYSEQMKEAKKKLPKEFKIQNLTIEKTKLNNDVEITGTFFTRNHKYTKYFIIKGLTRKIEVKSYINKKNISRNKIEKFIEETEKYLKALKKDKEIFENFDVEKFLEDNVEPFQENIDKNEI